MPSFNKVILAGNITKAPEMRYTPKGTATTRIGLAVNRTWKDDAGTKHEEVCFVDVDFWGRTAEVVSEHLRKGSPILIEGRLKLDQWEDKKTKEKKTRLGVVGESFSFLDGATISKAKPDAKPAEAAAKEAPAPADDDVPF